VVKSINLGLNFRFDVLHLRSIILSVVADVLVNSEMSVVTS
jgi:hypothetical protein